MEKVKEIISKHKKLRSSSIPITDVLEIIRLMQEDKEKQLKLCGVVSSFKMQGSRDGFGWECITLAETRDEALVKTIKKNTNSTDIRLIRNYGKPIF